jgi:hypothetical protein
MKSEEFHFGLFPHLFEKPQSYKCRTEKIQELLQPLQPVYVRYGIHGGAAVSSIWRLKR